MLHMRGAKIYRRIATYHSLVSRSFKHQSHFNWITILHGLHLLISQSHYCRFIGVADISAIRFSLPAQLLEPTPNLEYWNYLDQPNTFIAIGDSDEPLDRMLEVLRFWFTKDLKYVKGKPCKPYNSTLGEFFRVYDFAACPFKGDYI